MSGQRKTIGATLPNGDYVEVYAEERDGSGILSAAFSITGAVWHKYLNADGATRKRQGREEDAGGCIHAEILAAFPHLAPLVAVHLADPDGTPMHAEPNSWHYYSGAAEGCYLHAGPVIVSPAHDRAARALRIAPADLPTGLTRQAFAAFVTGLAPRWAADAARARAVLDTMRNGLGVVL